MAKVDRAQRRGSKLAAELARLGTLAPAELRSAWEALEGSGPPNVAASLLRRLLAQRMQEKRLGGLPSAVVRELQRAAAGPARSAVPQSPPEITPGTRFIREWQGRTIAVQAAEAGFVWEDRTYRSLSEIARAVTGARWSGPRFFGLTRRV